MAEIFIDKVLPGVAKLVMWISAGIALGTVLEALGIMRCLAFIAKPIIRLAKLPPIAMTAFVTSFVSPKSGNGMLSAAFSNKEINRRQLILSAAANSFPSTLMHLRMSGPIIIAMLGLAGACYVGFIIFGGFVVLITILAIAKFWQPPEDELEHEYIPEEASKNKFKETLKKAWDRWKKLLPKVLLVSIPLYTLVAWLNAAGQFKRLAKAMPGPLADKLPPEALTILVSQMTGATRAAPVARDFLESGELTHITVFIIMLTGYALSLPVRVLRRNLPSALSLFPGRNGLIITAISQTPRFLLALLIITVWIILSGGGAE